MSVLMYVRLKLRCLCRVAVKRNRDSYVLRDNFKGMSQGKVIVLLLFQSCTALFTITASCEPAHCCPQSHPYQVHHTAVRMNHCLHSFTSFSGKLWDRLPSSLFPHSSTLKYFKTGGSSPLGNLSDPAYFCHKSTLCFSVDWCLECLCFTTNLPQNPQCVSLYCKKDYRLRQYTTDLIRDISC